MSMAALLVFTHTEGVVALRRRAEKGHRLRATVRGQLAADFDTAPTGFDQFRSARLDEATPKERARSFSRPAGRMSAENAPAPRSRRYDTGDSST